VQNAWPADRQDILVTISRKHLLPLLIAAGMVACGGGDPTGPSAPSLAVTVTGLPGGTPAQVTVTGPGGYSQSLSGSQILAPLTAGSYNVTPSNVTVGSATYSGAPVSQTVDVGGSTSAFVTYSTASSGGSRLLVNINGLASGTAAAVTVTGPGGYNQTVATTQTLTGLASGTYTIAPQNITVGGTPYTASPSSQTAAITTATAAAVTVTYGAASSGALNLRIDGMYLTQSTQTYAGAVPLVQNRDGFLRVFVTANMANAAQAAVRIRFYQDFVLQSEQTVTAGLTVPTAPDESSLSSSWNLLVPGALIRPGLSINAEVDVANGVAESNEMDNAFPTAGPGAMNVRAVPVLNVTFVPVIQRINGLAGNVSNVNKAAYLDVAKRMHPIDAYTAVVHSAYTTSTSNVLQDDNANGAWTTILGEIDALRVAENSSRYYYGVAKVSYTSGVAGVAYVSNSNNVERAALGWDYVASGSAAEVAAHELGHNWGRNHAPCGGPGGVDASYPHPDGSTGVYGLDVAAQSLKPPTTSDIMGYCDPKWIGDYSYKAVLDYLSPASPMVTSLATSQTVQPCLLIWGHIRNGEMVLEPAFQVNTRPSLPARAGPYSVSAGAQDGTTLFSLSFAPKVIADVPGDQKNFVFAVPLSGARAKQLATLRLSGQGRQMVRRAPPDAVSGAQPGAGVKPQMAEVRRSSGGGMGVRWDARAHPMVMVRDAQTGEVLSFGRGGSVELSGARREVDLVLSDGVKSSVRRVSVTP
jgi:metallopeptidase family M12-like protein